MVKGLGSTFNNFFSFARHLSHYNMVDSMVVDDLHTVYLGVAKKIVNFFDEKHAFGDYKKYDLIDEELMQNKGIAEQSQIKGFSAICDWKGKDYLAFILYYGVPFLVEYSVDQKYTELLIKLNNAIFMCSKVYITNYDLDCVKREIEQFKNLFVELFGNSNMSPNFHEMTEHMIMAIKKTGPLWINSTFHFEKLNFINRNCVRSSLRPDIQITSR